MATNGNLPYENMGLHQEIEFFVPILREQWRLWNTRILVYTERLYSNISVIPETQGLATPDINWQINTYISNMV